MDFASARNQLRENIRQLQPGSFERIALEVFRFQAQFNPLYLEYLNLLGVRPDRVKATADIPFLPIQFFKNYNIKSGRDWTPELVFTSSGTTATLTSRHLVRDLSWYLQNTRTGFEFFYGKLERYAVLALLPSYLERSGSSLVAMADFFIRESAFPQSGFFLYNTEELIRVIKDCQKRKIPVLLIGVSFALLDLAEQHPVSLQGVTVMETGGMKGRRKELTREELHAIMKESFGLSSIHSEYGMTELFSQAYSCGEGVFHPAPTMQVRTREITDPLSPQSSGKTGVLNIIDLANIDTISFIATDDLGKVYQDGSFEVLGRLDASDIRGCNLLLQEVAMKP